ncbi:MAG: DUF6134 family protein [Methylocella sp.]
MVVTEVCAAFQAIADHARRDRRVTRAIRGLEVSLAARHRQSPFVSLLALLRYNVAGNPQKMVIIMRTIAFSLTLLVLSMVPAGADKAAAVAKLHKVFDIVRGGDKIGTDTIDIERQNDTTTVKIKTDLSVKVMFVEAYRYEHSCNETWKNGQLIAFKSRTNDNGTKHSVDVMAGQDKLSMDADGKHSDLPKTAVPASLWGKDAIPHFDAFDPDTGKRLSIEVTDLGNETLTIHGMTHEVHHYKIADTPTGDFAREVWFDGDALVRTKIVGSDNSVILSDLR